MYVKFCYIWNNSEEKKSTACEFRDKSRTDLSDITRFRLFRAVAAILSVICLTLLMVIIALATKLQTQSACEAQNTMKKGSDVSSLCSKEHCMSIYPQSQVYTTNCQKCGKGWVEFEAFCFFFSRERHTWSESRKECQKRGGDLTVLDQDRVQNFLSKMSKDFCWIGLSRSPSGQWAWVDNTTLGKSYWSEDSMWADCAYMDGSMLANQSWKTAECSVVTYYICQKNR